MAKIFSHIGKKVADIDYSDRIPDNAYDTTFDNTQLVNRNISANNIDTVFDKTKMVDRPISPNNIDTTFVPSSIIDLYNINGVYGSVSSINSNQGLMQNYYNKYGYTSLIGDTAGYLVGLKNASGLLQNGLSTLIPGASKSGIGAFVLNTVNIALRHPFVSGIINNFLPSPFNLRPEGIIKWQYLPSQTFLTTNPPQDYISTKDSGDGILGIISNAATSILVSTLSGLSNSGTITGYDWERAFGKGLDTVEVITMAQSGLKYTRAVGWFDPTKPIWSDRPGFITYDKYIAYSDGQISYSTMEDPYKNSLLYRLDPTERQAKSLSALAKEPSKLLKNAPIVDNSLPNNIPFISNGILSNGIDTTKTYQAAMGQTTNPDTEPEKLYLNTPGLREEVQRLGFPQYNMPESQNYGIKGDNYDLINATDLIEDSAQYDYANAKVKDLIDFRFEDISSKGRDNPVTILFRAAIKNLNEDISPDWTDIKYLGRPDTFYIYDGFTRKITFDMTVYCNSKIELIPQWRKLNRLAGMCYPVSYAGGRAMKAPILRLTIGNLYRRVYGFLDTFGITVPEDAFWDTELGYQLPMIVDVKVGFTIIYETDGAGAPRTDAAHFNQGTLFPIKGGQNESIYGNRVVKEG